MMFKKSQRRNLDLSSRVVPRALAPSKPAQVDFGKAHGCNQPVATPATMRPKIAVVVAHLHFRASSRPVSCLFRCCTWTRNLPVAHHCAGLPAPIEIRPHVGAALAVG